MAYIGIDALNLLGEFLAHIMISHPKTAAIGFVIIGDEQGFGR
jgi:hypothetical protein